MEVKNGGVFNLWDTNGRRSDVLNAVNIYLNILNDLNSNDGDRWGKYPTSLKQFNFYEAAIMASPEVFQKHDKYDKFIKDLGQERDLFLTRDKKWLSSRGKSFYASIDEGIEDRARHYTSNLVKFGFATDTRDITEVGYSYMKLGLIRDDIEKMLPIDDMNLLLIRQLMKLRITTSSKNGKVKYYSPFYMALYLLMNYEISETEFRKIVQGSSPYFENEDISLLFNEDITLEEKAEFVCKTKEDIPTIFLTSKKVNFDNFIEYIKNQKSNKVKSVYYDFYSALYDYVYNPSAYTYSKLKESYFFDKEKIKKAFLMGENTLNFGVNGTYSFEQFKSKNNKVGLLKSEGFNKRFYSYYLSSKKVDMIFEYSDTTVRVLSATGLFRFKSLPTLSFKTALGKIFDIEKVKKSIFGSMSDNENLKHDEIYGKNMSIKQILDLTNSEIESIIDNVCEDYNGDYSKMREIILDEVSKNFHAHIEKNYSKEKVIEILKLFNDRKNDSKIKKLVNEAASVPTIYEYIMGIAWYYISNKDFNLFEAFNLTLNADFEPVIHAGGGKGDILIDYPEKTVLLEVTLMNPSSQQRSEMESVMRHSRTTILNNNKRKHYTFFVSQDLDPFTMMVWRNAYEILIESEKKMKIMPFTNNEISKLLEQKVSRDRILEQVDFSYGYDAGESWRENITNKLFS